MNPTAELLDQAPPHDLDAEKAVLGSLLLAPGKLPEVAATVQPADFYADANRRVFQAVKAMVDAGGPVDAVLLADHLRSIGQLESVGGVLYLTELAQSVPLGYHARHHAAIVAKHAARRAVIQAGLDLVQQGHAAGTDTAKLLDGAEQRLASVRTGQYDGAPVDAPAAANQSLERVLAIQAKQRAAGLPTGLPEFDQTIGGLFPGELVILAARTGLGKTSLGCQIAHHTAGRGRLVYFASLEMSAAELSTRMLCADGDVDSRQIRTGRITQPETDRLVKAAQPWSDLPLKIHDRPGITVAEIARWTRRLKRDGLALVVVDYLQRLTPQDRRIARHEQIGQMTDGLKRLARELDVPVLCLAQLSRQAEGEPLPRLSHLRESGSIEQDADVVAFLHHARRGCEDTGEDDRQAKLMIEKNRNGPTGVIGLTWIAERTRFEGAGWDVARRF